MTRNIVLMSLCAVSIFVGATVSAEPTSVLVESGQRDTLNARRGYSIEAGEHAGRRASRVFWSAGGNTLNEVAFRTRPDLLAYDAGVQLEIDINTDDFPGLSNVGVRVVDSMGEIHQYGRLRLPDGEGWKTWKVDLSPDRVTDRWGGGEQGKGQIDPPVKLLSLLFNAPEKPEERRSILVGEIRRNQVDADTVEPHAALGGLELELQTGQPIRVLFKGDEEQFVYRISSPEHNPETSFRLKLTLTDYQGESSAWSSQVLTLAPGASAEVALAEALPGMGWYRIDPLLEVADGSAELRRPARQVAYIDPVGARSLPPEDGFYFGLDSRQRQPEMLKMLSMLGVDMLRYGTWSGVNTAGGGWRWPTFDEDVKRIRELGMQVLYSVTFTPDYAAKPEYRQRREAGERIGNKVVTLANTPPREEALRDAVRTIIEHNQQYGMKVYDLWNEPDLSGFWQGTTDEYLDFMRICYETIKSVQPDAIVLGGGIAVMSGHGGHSLNPDMIERMIVDAQDHYDAISVHLHGHFKGFQGQIDGVLADLRSRLREDKPLWFTETGYNGEPLKMADVLVQKFAFARARGAAGFIWYAMYAPGRSPYGMVDRNGDPLPVVPAYNEMVRLMRGKRFDQQHDVGRGNWLLSFTGGDETLMIGWDEDADARGRTELVRVPQGARVRLLNVLGSEQPIERFENVVVLPFETDLRYLVVSGGAPELLGAPASLADAPRGEVGQVVPVVAKLHNPLQRQATFELRWKLPDGSEQTRTMELDGGADAEASIDVTIPAAASGQAQPGVALSYSLANSPIAGQQSLRIEAVRLIPAQAMTSRDADFAMLGRDNIHNPNEADPTRAHLAWGGPADLSAKVWLALEVDAIVLRVDVTDDRHVQSKSPAELWQADSVQFAMTVPQRAGMWNFGLARHEDGQDMVHVFNTPAGVAEQYGQSIELTTTPRSGGMVYEARLPLKGFGADADTLRSRGVRFNLLVNDDDGAGRKGFGFISPGMGRGGMEPDLWPGLIFE
jgi:hypothetical protein